MATGNWVWMDDGNGGVEKVWFEQREPHPDTARTVSAGDGMAAHEVDTVSCIRPAYGVWNGRDRNRGTPGKVDKLTQKERKRLEGELRGDIDLRKYPLLKNMRRT